VIILLLLLLSYSEIIIIILHVRGASYYVSVVLLFFYMAAGVLLFRRAAFDRAPNRSALPALRSTANMLETQFRKQYNSAHVGVGAPKTNGLNVVLI